MTISRMTLAAALVAASPALAEDAPADTIVVSAPRITRLQAVIDAEDDQQTGPDAAGFIARQPGAALIDNGALSGQVQLRGLFGDRILLRINGQNFATGGPNAMDPPMHYAPMVLVDRVEIARGISPVRDGPGLGGGVNAVLKQVQFGTGDVSLSPQADITGQVRSVDESFAVGGIAGLASRDLRLGVIASWEEGGDTRFPGGRIAGTSYRRGVYGVHAGVRTGPGTLSFEYRRQETGRSGNPPFAMDIIYFHTDFARLGFEGDVADGVQLAAHADYTAVRHRMNNFTLRPAPVTVMQRETDTYANTLGADLALRFGSDRRHLRIGADLQQVDNGYVITNPAMPAFFVYALDRGQRERIAGFAEWRTGAGPVEAELGVRVDSHRARVAAPRFGPGLQAGPAGLALAFGNGVRAWQGTTVDAALRLWAEAGSITPRLTLARKTRVPSLIERFSWLPTEASGGLADGNIYVGDPRLTPETAWIAEVGFDWQSSTAYARPVIYYRRVDNFIQGVPFDGTPGLINTSVEMVSAANGDATPLRFANIDAEIWGADIAFGTRLAGPLRLDGVASYVRGRRRDIPDNLYRIAPPNGRLALAWDANDWMLAFEVQGFAAQNRVSTTNSEATTLGYVLANLTGHWLIRDGLRLDAGIENLFDRQYLEHLAGYNRIAQSDVPVGARLPGPGRSAFIRLRWALG